MHEGGRYSGEGGRGEEHNEEAYFFPHANYYSSGPRLHGMNLDIQNIEGSPIFLLIVSLFDFQW